MTKVIDKRIRIEAGIFYKEIIKTTVNSDGKVTEKRNHDKVYIIRYKDNGKERYVRLGKKSEGINVAYCRVKKAEFITLAINGELPTQVKRKVIKSVTLNDLSVNYFKGKKEFFNNGYELRGSSKRLSSKYDNHLKKKLGSKDIKDITSADFEEIKIALEKLGRAGKTINGVMDLARAIINKGIADGLIDVNVAKGVGVNKKKADKKRDRFLSIEEVHVLLEAVREDHVLYRFILLALSTGARLGTLLNVKAKDINFTSGAVKLHDFKTSTEYTGFIDSDEQKSIMKKHCESLEVNDFYIDMNSRTLGRKLKKIFDRLFNVGLDADDTINRVVVHTLRHTFASQLVTQGKSLYIVQKLMNHSDIKMTERYAKLAPEAGLMVVKDMYGSGNHHA